MRRIWLVIVLSACACSYGGGRDCQVVAGPPGDGCDYVKSEDERMYLDSAHRILIERGVDINRIRLNIIEVCSDKVYVVYADCSYGSEPIVHWVEVSLDGSYVEYMGN